MSWDHEKVFASDFSETAIFLSVSRNLGSKKISVIVYNIFAYLTLSLSTTQRNDVQEWCRLTQINVFHEHFPHWVNVLFLSIFISSTQTDKNNPFSRLTNKHFEHGTLSQPYTFLRTTFHIIEPWRNTKNSRSMEVVRFLPRKIVIQTWFYKCKQYICLFHMVFEYIPGIHDQGMTLVLPNQLLCFCTFHIGFIFSFFPANLMSSTYTDKNNPFFAMYE